jgi:hypothetical protein
MVTNVKLGTICEPKFPSWTANYKKDSDGQKTRPNSTMEIPNVSTLKCYLIQSLQMIWIVLTKLTNNDFLTRHFTTSSDGPKNRREGGGGDRDKQKAQG